MEQLGEIVKNSVKFNRDMQKLFTYVPCELLLKL